MRLAALYSVQTAYRRAGSTRFKEQQETNQRSKTEQQKSKKRARIEPQTTRKSIAEQQQSRNGAKEPKRAQQSHEPEIE
jgi:hypothetical protein